MPQKRDWKLLGDTMRARRERLGLTQQDVVRDAAIGEVTYRNIEGARRENVRPATLHEIDRALQWEPGTSIKLLDHSIADKYEGSIQALVDAVVSWRPEDHRRPEPADGVYVPGPDWHGTTSAQWLQYAVLFAAHAMQMGVDKDLATTAMRAILDVGDELKEIDRRMKAEEAKEIDEASEIGRRRVGRAEAERSAQERWAAYSEPNLGRRIREEMDAEIERSARDEDGPGSGA